MNTTTPGISVVIPVYRSAEILPALLPRLEAVLRARQTPFEVLLVNDASPDDSWSVIAQAGAEHDWVRGLDLMRNYGQHNALLCGIRLAQHDVIVTLDDDLQHPPEELPKLLDALTAEVDVVYGPPASGRVHGLARNLATALTRRVLQHSLGAETARHVSAFRVFRTSLRAGFDGYSGPWVNLDVLLTWSTTRFTAIPVEHHEREAGTSGYTFAKLLRHAANMVTGFSTLPLTLATWVGFAFTGFGFLVLLWVVGRTLIEGTVVPGFAFLASCLAIFSGAQLFSLGILGEYLARVHVRVMDKPAYVVRSDTARTDPPA